MEHIVKDLIRESLNKRIEGHGSIDTILSNSKLIDCWLTDIMALGYNDSNIEQAVEDVYELQKPMIEVLVPEKSIEDYRARLFLSINRFSDEIFAFQKYLELKDSASEEVVIWKVKEELENVEEGDFIYC
jgi:hypothetical protein